MKKVLIVEDDINVFNMLKNSLGSSFQLVRARSVSEAIGAVEEEGPFDCFVVDLNIFALGLTIEEMVDYQRREGYAFLKNYLWKGKLENYKWEGDNPEKIKELKGKTIICSRYTIDLRKEERGEIDGIKMVLKDYGFEKKLFDLVKAICHE